MQLKPLGKLIILILVVGGAIGGWRLWERSHGTPGGDGRQPVVPRVGGLPSAQPGGGATSGGPGGASSAAPVTLAGFEPGCPEKPEVRMLLYAWNSQMGLMYAVGGPQSAKGSLMAKKGVNLKVERQDDNGKLTEALVAFATELKNGKANPTAGAHFVAVMGDGTATFLKGANDTLKKLGPEYRAKVVGSFGYSRGEDKFMGPPEWKQDPQKAMGGVVAGVLRDGDWNIAQKWLADNGLRTNPDDKTYDPDALNWVNANDYIDAAQKYVAGYSEEREVVKMGRRTGQKKKITVQGIVTWTPGDVTAAQEKGGLVSIVSTKEYSTQMPNAVIGIDKWMKENRTTVESFLSAGLEGGEMVRKDGQALQRAGEVSAAVYREKDAAYWVKYYKGVKETDKAGLEVELGGSQANNLYDALLTFGLIPKSSNLFAATYQVFGDLVVQQYPDLVPSIDPVDEVMDTSYLAALQKADAAKVTAQVPKPVAAAPASKPGHTAAQPKLKRVISRKAWRIEFETGKAKISPKSIKELKKLMQDLLVASGTSVEIHGHTDNVGSPEENMKLSEARAFAVKAWLEKQAPVNFRNRLRVFAHGQTNPLAPNTTEANRARNRRVEIVIGL